jgi:hypothetical protein
MPVADFQSLLKSLLELTTDGQEHSLKEAEETPASWFGLVRRRGKGA